jgi:hypothetical protein
LTVADENDTASGRRQRQAPVTPSTSTKRQRRNYTSSTLVPSHFTFSGSRWSKKLPVPVSNVAMAPMSSEIEVNPFLQHETQQFLQVNRVQPEAWQAVATRHKKSIAQVILRWLSQRGIVVLSKSVRKERILETFNVLDFEVGISFRILAPR